MRNVFPRLTPTVFTDKLSMHFVDQSSVATEVITNKRLTIRVIVLLGILALTIALARIAFFHSSRPYFFGQGYMYKEIALALASGHGFAEPHGPWPGHPTITRPPLWPFVLSFPMRLCFGCDPLVITRFVEGIMHALTAFGVALLVGMLSGSIFRMLLAVLVTALLPEAQPLLLGGYCEPFATAILVFGIILMTSGKRFFSGVFVLSLLPLVRPNFLILWIAVMVVIGCRQFHGPFRINLANWRQLTVAAVLFFIPSAGWVARNYFASGRFPILAGTSSMTFYGNYNPVSGAWGRGFGKWIDPNKIPGEEKMTDLSKRFSEADALRTWDLKGKQFIAHHWRVVALLLVAHIVRTFLPSSDDGAHQYFFWMLRLILYGAAILAIRQNSFSPDSWFDIVLNATVLVCAITVVLYSGDGRYLYPLHVLLLVLVFSTRYARSAS
jgi:hypothetical protein